MIAKVCSQKNKNRDYFSSGWCIKTISATCCLHRDRVQAKMSCQKCCIIDCVGDWLVGDWLVGDWLVRGRVGMGVQCALCTACLCFSLCSLPCFLASKDIFACSLSLCKQQVGATDLNATATTKIVPVLFIFVNKLLQSSNIISFKIY